MTHSPSNYAETLKALGLKLTVAPGEFIINFEKGGTATEYRTDNLADALAHAQTMGPPPDVIVPLGPMGKGRQSQRAKMYAHNRKLAARRQKTMTNFDHAEPDDDYVAEGPAA